eukprot:6835574-Prorocentrum_lima.AAC.1
MRGRSAFRKRARRYAKLLRRWRAAEHRRAQIQERLRQTYVKLLHYKYTLARIQAVSYTHLRAHETRRHL